MPRVVLTARAEARDLRIVLRPGSDAAGGETRSPQRLGHVRDGAPQECPYPVAAEGRDAVSARAWPTA